jgi:thiamine transport system ATP-binding protein
MLQVRDLRVSYGDVVAVADIDFDLAGGETLALLGHSGSGKTTVLKAIAGLVPIDGGTIELDGRDLTAIPTHRRGVGLVFQDFALFPHLDVGANVGYGLRMAGITDVEAPVAAALELVGLSGYAKRRIDQLSGGQAQRVALARTLAAEPRLLLLDEPLGSLDPDLRTGLATELDELLHRTGIPTIVVTHDTAEAFALGDRLAVIVDGHIAVSGRPQQVWLDPGSEEAARLLGHRNLLHAHVTDGVAEVGSARIPVEGPNGRVTLLARPGSVELDGDVEARVVTARYRGPDWIATVRLGDDTVEVPLPDRPRSGSIVRIDIDPAGIVSLS